MNATPHMQAYFENLDKEVKIAHAIAKKAKEHYYDPTPHVEIALAKNMAERVVGLISVIAPQIVDSGVVERIIELEKEYGALDWRVALKIAEEISLQKFCKFDTQEQAVDVGIRTGFAYSTVGVVSSPLDGLITITLKKRMDGRGQFMSLSYAGPIRNAGGTNAAVSAIIADYVRKKLGYDVYDATDEEIKRFITEIHDYDERIAPRQHKPSDEELIWLFKNIPVEIAGEPSETLEVSNYKDLPRIPTNQIRSGFALLCTDCIPLKAPKLWKQLAKWGKAFDLEHWNFLEKLIEIQKKAKAHGQTKTTDQKITPNYSFITDLVAGRPILGYPLRKGAFRLRYGRSRVSGYSAQSIHPATMIVLDDYIASATQLKCERPGKGAVYTPCDHIDGPIVKLEDERVIKLSTESHAHQVKKQVKEILFLGDVLISYGDFLNRAHILAPPGYCEEWWIQELEKAALQRFGTLDKDKIAHHTEISLETINKIFTNPIKNHPTAHEAIQLSKQLDIPLHPEYTYYWNDLTKEQLTTILSNISKFEINKEDNQIHKIIIPHHQDLKRAFELIGIPHLLATNEFIVFQKNEARALATTLNLEHTTTAQALDLLQQPEQTILQIINKLSPIRIKDKSGIYIGSRMGRPEKAKMRKMTGSPHGLFPVGNEGGRMRSIQSALEKKQVTADFANYWCEQCKQHVVLPTCPFCNNKALRHYYCRTCNKHTPELMCPLHGPTQKSVKTTININEYVRATTKKIAMRIQPDLVKGVRGTSNKDHIPEHPAKAFLRAKHDVHVNKDGTIRYDCSEVPITHFRSKEIGTPIEKLKTLGYDKDIHGQPLENDNQILEIKPQDIILPANINPLYAPADEVFLRVTQFVDDLLTNLYNEQPFYNITKKEELIGHLIIALAPHTSAGIIGRIIGFSKTQGFLAHPYIHAAERRDCDGDEIGFMLIMDAFLNFSKSYLPESRGSTMDVPLVLTSILTPTEVDDMAFDLDIAWKYPLEFYEACEQYKMPWEIKIRRIADTLDKPEQYEGMGFTHDTTNINAGVLCSAYKTIPSMEDKLKGQMALAMKIRAVDSADVAQLVIEKHFIRDTKGNLRKFSMQQFRCVNCNEKFRRPPLRGKCTDCGGKLIFTIAEGSVVKYLEPTISLANNYGVTPYLKQTIDLLKERIESVFGRDKERQSGLGAWFG